MAHEAVVTPVTAEPAGPVFALTEAAKACVGVPAVELEPRRAPRKANRSSVFVFTHYR